MSVALGLAANISGVAGFSDIVQKLGNIAFYLHEGRSVDKDLASIKDRVEQFRAPWELLDSRLKRPEQNPELVDLSQSLSKFVPQIKTNLERLETAFSRSNQSSTWDKAKRLPLWPFEKESLEETLKNLECYTKMATLTVSLNHE